MFTTPRTTLRAYGPSDLPLLLALLNNPLVQNTLIPDPIIPCNHRFVTKIEELANEALLYVVIEATGLPTGPQVIGAANITISNLKNRDVTLGIALDPQVWGQRYGTEVTTHSWLTMHSRTSQYTECRWVFWIAIQPQSSCIRKCGSPCNNLSTSQ